jgi:hypothetical protein
MNRFSRLAALALLPCLIFAQEKKQAEPPRPANVVTKMIRLQHANPQQVRNLLVGAGAAAYWDDTLRVVVVSGTPSEVASLEQTVKDLDSEMAKITVLNAELTVYVLGASQESGAVNHIPASLQKTVGQIKAAFPYQSYRLLETIIARCAIGDENAVSGTLQPFQENQPSEPSYTLHFRLSGIDNTPTGALFHIRRFNFGATFPYVISTAPNTTQFQQSRASVQTDFDISSGQQVVIGKAGVAGKSAVFLIVEAKAVK